MALNIRKAFGFDKEKVEKGFDLDLGDGASLKILSSKNAKFIQEWTILQKEFESSLRSSDEATKTKASEKFVVELLARAGIIGWTGIVDDEGKDLPFSVEAARNLLTEYEDFRSLVTNATNDRTNIAYAANDAIAKN